jgi:propionyl-CoA carboxylase alpha chain
VQASNRAQARVWARLPSGWRNNPSQSQELCLRRAHDDAEMRVSYLFDRSGGVAVTVDDTAVDVVLHDARADAVDATVHGVRRRFAVAVSATTIDVDSPLGSSSYAVVPRFPDLAADVAAGSLVAPMPGSVVRVLVEKGAQVSAGDPLVVLEAMKMEHTVAAVAAGVVTEVPVNAGQQVEAGAVLVVVEETTDAD